jgi:hypothetical protein
MMTRTNMRIAGLGIALAAIPALTLSVSAQIRTPDNSYPPTPWEQAQTADLNRQATQNDNGYRAPDEDYRRRMEQYRRAQEAYSGQVWAYQKAQREYWYRLHVMGDWERDRARYRPTPASLERDREHQTDGGIVGQQIQVLTGDYVGRVIRVDRDMTHKIDGLFVQLDGGKVVWIDISDVRYDSPYGVIYTDLAPEAFRHMPDERS